VRVRDFWQFALLTGGLALLFAVVTLNQQRQDSIRTTEDFVGYEAPWVHPADLMKRSQQLHNRGS